MPFIKQTIGLAIYYALKDPTHRISILLAIVFVIFPSLIFSAFFANGIKRSWLYFIGLTVLLILIVPVGHYMIPIIPFLSMLAANAIEEKRIPRWWYLAVLLIPTFRFTAGAFVSPWGPFGRRQYGLMDMYYEADVVKNLDLKPPIWTAWGPIYFINKWPIIGNSFIDMMQGGENIDWTKKPYCDVNTRLYFYSQKEHPIKAVEGWDLKWVPLSRGQYFWLEVWNKK